LVWSELAFQMRKLHVSDRFAAPLARESLVGFRLVNFQREKQSAELNCER
jgi:hypothetical protein